MDKLDRNTIPLDGARDDKLDEIVEAINVIEKKLKKKK